MISSYFRYRFRVTRLKFLSYSLLEKVCCITYIMHVIVPVMFLCFQGFLDHNKSSHPGAVVDEDVQSMVIARLVGRY
ncbi:hypothetical protein Hanom_Chr02g00161031 [Helianthus anomalus]